MGSRGAKEGPAATNRPPPIVFNLPDQLSQGGEATPVGKLAFPLRIVAFNAQGGKPLDAIVRRLSQPPLAGAGIILLCEAGWRSRMSAGLEFARDLGEKLGMSSAYVPEYGIVDGGRDYIRSIGNAILAKCPLENVRSVPIVHFPRPRRAHLRGQSQGLLATVRCGGVDLTVGVVHLDSRVDPGRRNRQMTDFMNAIPVEGPVVIGGDLNTTTVGLTGSGAVLQAALQIIAAPRRLRAPQPYEPLFRTIADHGFILDDANLPGASTFAVSGLIPRAIRPKLDWIAMRGMRAVTGSAAVVSARGEGLIGRRFSDHDLIVCDVIVG